MSLSTYGLRGRVIAVAVVVCSYTAANQGVLPAANATSIVPVATASDPSATAADGSVVPRDLLPDLVTLPLEAFHLTYEDKGKVLRFSTSVMNIGNGPLDITGVRSSVTDPNLKVTQTILRSDGSRRTVSTGAVMRYAVLDGHDHFHVQEYERYQLRPLGESAWRGSHKEGFCLRDDANLAGKHASRYPDLDCGEDEEDEALQVRQGQTEGWVDVYDWYLPGQFIDLDGLSLPGDFCVAADVDPQQHLTEATRSNNSTSTVVHITDNDVSVVRQGC